MSSSIEAQNISLIGVEESGEVNLGGQSLTSVGNMSLRGITLSSGQLGAITAGGLLSMDQSSTATGNVEFYAESDMDLSGSFEGLSIEIQGNMLLSGALSPTVSVDFVGSQQILVTDSDHKIGSLLLHQTGDAPSLEIQALNQAIEITVTNVLSLNSGILTTGPNALKISESGRVERLSPGITSSHVNGNMKWSIEEGAIEEFNFPIGTASTYLPLSVTFTQPLLSNTVLIASVENPSSLSLAGLPLAVQPSDIVSVMPPVWQIASTINFARAQEYTLSTTIGSSPPGVEDALKLLTRETGRGQDPWTLVSESTLNALTNDGLILRAFGARGGLTPAGTNIAIGTPTPQGEDQVLLQLVNLLASQPGTSAMLTIDTTVALALSGGEVSTGVIPFLSDESAGLAWRLELLAAGMSHFSESVIPADERRVTGILHESELGEIVGTIARWQDQVLSEIGTVSVRFLNLLSPETEIDLILLDGEQTLVQAGIHQASELISLAAGTQMLEVRNSINGELIDVFRIDLTMHNQSELILTAVYQSGEEQLIALTSSGDVILSSIVTGLETETESLPISFRLTGNYPNPFNPLTNIGFDLPEQAEVRLQVFDIVGRLVKSMDVGSRFAGPAQVIRFDGSRLASGTYFYVLNARTERNVMSQSGTMILLK